MMIFFKGNGLICFIKIILLLCSLYLWRSFFKMKIFSFLFCCCLFLLDFWYKWMLRIKFFLGVINFEVGFSVIVNLLLYFLIEIKCLLDEKIMLFINGRLERWSFVKYFIEVLCSIFFWYMLFVMLFLFILLCYINVIWFNEMNKFMCFYISSYCCMVVSLLSFRFFL